MGGLELLIIPMFLTLEFPITKKFFRNVKIHIVQQKNHNFFVKQVMKTMVIPLNKKHFGVCSMKNSFENYERFKAQRAKFKPSD